MTCIHASSTSNLFNSVQNLSKLEKRKEFKLKDDSINKDYADKTRTETVARWLKHTIITKKRREILNKERKLSDLVWNRIDKKNN